MTCFWVVFFFFLACFRSVVLCFYEHFGIGAGGCTCHKNRYKNFAINLANRPKLNGSAQLLYTSGEFIIRS